MILLLSSNLLLSNILRISCPLMLLNAIYIMYIMQVRQRPELYIRELIRVIFDQLAHNEKPSVHKFWVLKILYLVKKQLPQSNPIKDDLAFYWYKYGPFSDVIVNILDKDEHINKNSDGSYSYSEQDRNTHVMDHDESIREALSKVIPIVEKFRKSDIRKEVYDDAPYQWYESYSSFKKMLDTYYRHTFEKGRDSNPYIRADILEALDETLGTKSLEERFTEFRLAYNGFVRMVISILKVPDIENYKDEFYRLCQISEDIWDVFAKGIRTRYHDRYYTDQVEKWELDYQNAVSKLIKDIDQAEETLKIPDIEDDTPDEDLETFNIDMNNVKSYTPSEMIKKIDEIVKL